MAVVDTLLTSLASGTATVIDLTAPCSGGSYSHKGEARPPLTTALSE